jgi:hypothetical protein
MLMGAEITNNSDRVIIIANVVTHQAVVYELQLEPVEA